MDCVVIYLDAERRVKFYRQGGTQQERKQGVFGWALAWDEDWSEDLRAVLPRIEAGISNLEIVEGV